MTFLEQHIDGQLIAWLRQFTGSLIHTKSSPSPVKALCPPVMWHQSRFPSLSLTSWPHAAHLADLGTGSWVHSASLLPLCTCTFILQRLSSPSVFSPKPFKISWYFYRTFFFFLVIALFWHLAHCFLILDSPKCPLKEVSG